jgi:hypothetical protein
MRGPDLLNRRLADVANFTFHLSSLSGRAAATLNTGRTSRLELGTHGRAEFVNGRSLG